MATGECGRVAYKLRNGSIEEEEEEMVIVMHCRAHRVAVAAGKVYLTRRQLQVRGMKSVAEREQPANMAPFGLCYAKNCINFDR